MLNLQGDGISSGTEVFGVFCVVRWYSEAIRVAPPLCINLLSCPQWLIFCGWTRRAPGIWWRMWLEFSVWAVRFSLWLSACPRVEKNGNYDPLKLNNERVVLKKEEWWKCFTWIHHYVWNMCQLSRILHGRCVYEIHPERFPGKR